MSYPGPHATNPPAPSSSRRSSAKSSTCASSFVTNSLLVKKKKEGHREGKKGNERRTEQEPPPSPHPQTTVDPKVSTSRPSLVRFPCPPGTSVSSTSVSCPSSPSVAVPRSGLRGETTWIVHDMSVSTDSLPLLLSIRTGFSADDAPLARGGGGDLLHEVGRQEVIRGGGGGGGGVGAGCGDRGGRLHYLGKLGRREGGERGGREGGGEE